MSSSSRHLPPSSQEIRRQISHFSKPAVISWKTLTDCQVLEIKELLVIPCNSMNNFYFFPVKVNLKGRASASVCLAGQ